MTKKTKSRTKGVSRKQIRAIKSYSHKGYSANKIQRNLKARHMGMRRTKLLGYVREFKHKPPKAHVERYTPQKYRRGKPVSFGFGPKQVAVWRGDKRVQIIGSGQQLKQVMKYVIKHPPKKRFLTISAEALLNDPDKYLEGRWSDRPNVESR